MAGRPGRHFPEHCHSGGKIFNTNFDTKTRENWWWKSIAISRAIIAQQQREKTSRIRAALIEYPVFQRQCSTKCRSRKDVITLASDNCILFFPLGTRQLAVL